jgi:hypothetical protein
MDIGGNKSTRTAFVADHITVGVGPAIANRIVGLFLRLVVGLFLRLVVGLFLKFTIAHRAVRLYVGSFKTVKQRAGGHRKDHKNCEE